MAHNYIVQVTAGTGYDITKHQIVPVNQPKPVSLESELISVDVNVRVQSYRGLPRSSPSTSPYFDVPPHDKNKDQYSISFRFMPKKENINGDDLVFGNDFDHPIRDRLPPGFGAAFKLVKWVIDPGLDGDVYADQPYLYGPAVSSVNTLWVGGKEEESEAEAEAGMLFQEGGNEEGMEMRAEMGVPDNEAGRRKHFLDPEARKEWEWEQGKVYGCDFFNPYLDFNNFALRLPGITIPVMRYWDGQGLRKRQKRSHTLRYVLKNRKTDTVLLVVLFTLYLKEDVNENGIVKDGVEGGKPFDLLPADVAENHQKKKLGISNGNEAGHDTVNNHLPETSADDVD